MVASSKSSSCHATWSFLIAIIHAILMCHKRRRICVALPLWQGMRDCIVLLALRYDLTLVRIHQVQHIYIFVGFVTRESDIAVVILQLSSSTLSLAYFLGTL